MSSSPLLCPSAPCKPGALLLGIVQGNGRVALASERVEVDEEFSKAVREGRAAEKRFRFAGTCVRGACQQWTGTHCGVIDFVIEQVPAAAAPPELRPCAIRSECRWYHQRRADACRVCPLVITDVRADAVTEPAAVLASGAMQEDPRDEAD